MIMSSPYISENTKDFFVITSSTYNDSDVPIDAEISVEKDIDLITKILKTL